MCHRLGMARLLLAFLTAFVLPLWGAPKFVMKLVGSVEGKVITSRDVKANYVVDNIIYDRRKGWGLHSGTAQFRDALNRLLIEMVVYSEARTFGVARLEAAETEKTFKQVMARLNSDKKAKKAWESLGFSTRRLKFLVKRKLQANRFIKYKSNSSYVQVTDAEAREYFSKNRLKFGTSNFDSFRKNIKKYLAKKNAEDRLRNWFDVLKAKYKVKNFVVTQKI